jgi:hypothetical protein
MTISSLNCGRASADAAKRETPSVLVSLIRHLLPWSLNSVAGSLRYPALILFVLVLLGQSTGLVAPPG